MKASVNIQYTSTPASTDIDFLAQKINQETPEFGEANPFEFFIRDDNNQIIAGCNGSVIFGSIYTDQLWVHPNYRKNGLGHKLMEAVHDYGRKSNGTMIHSTPIMFVRSVNRKFTIIRKPGCWQTVNGDQPMKVTARLRDFISQVFIVQWVG